MKRSGFRKLTYAEALEKKRAELPKNFGKFQFEISPKERVKKASPLTTAPRRRKPKSDLQKLKAKLWALCREIQIRVFGRNCYTCGARDLQGSNCHLGHFIPSAVCSAYMRYELNNLRPCCYHCNINLSGNWVAYERHLKADGIDVEGLKLMNELTKGEKYGEEWYEAKIEEYQKLLETL